MTDAKRDANQVTTLLAVSSVDGVTPVTLYADPVTHRLLVDSAAGSGATTALDNLASVAINAALVLGTSDAFALGSATKMWSDLFLASGAVINFNNGDVTITHAANALAFAGGTVSFDAAPTVGGSAVYYAGGTDVAVADGGTGLSSIAALSTIVANSANTYVAITPGAGNSIRVNAGGTAWEAFTPSASTPTVITVADEATDTTCFISFFTAATGDLGPKTNTNMTFNSSTGVATFASTVLTTTDINGGTVDGAIIGGASAAAGTFTAVIANSFVPNSATIPTDGLYLSAANTLGFAIGSAAEILLTASAFSPAASDGNALGTATLMWADLFLASGAVINFNNGDVTLTHSADALTLAGGTLALGANSLTMTGSIAATGARVTKGWFTDLESTNMPTVGGTAILTSLTAPQFTTIELGAASDTTLSRVSAGVIAVEGVTILTVAGGTLTGSITLGENTGIILDPAGSADGKYSGVLVTGVAGYAQTYGDLVYLASADSRWELADADAATTADRMMAMVVVAGGSDGAACTLLLQGIIRADAKFPALTIGSAVYVGETAGAIQVAIPTGADNVIRRVGYALTADEIYFNPSMDSQISVA